MDRFAQVLDVIIRAARGYYCVVLDDDAYRAALRLARGSYQRAILRGVESLSGATLRGRARAWSSSYRRSRDSLLARLDDAGIPVSEIRVRHGGRRVLVIG